MIVTVIAVCSSLLLFSDALLMLLVRIARRCEGDGAAGCEHGQALLGLGRGHCRREDTAGLLLLLLVVVGRIRILDGVWGKRRRGVGGKCG